MQRLLSFLPLLLLLGVGACDSAPLASGTDPHLLGSDAGVDVDASDEIGHTTAALTGRVDDRLEDGQVCTPYALNLIDRAMTVATSVVHTDAFAACVRHRVGTRVSDCDSDPFFDETPASQSNRLIAALRNGNHVEPNCRLDEGTDWASAQGHMGEDTKDWLFGAWWTLAKWDEFDRPWPPAQPWNFLAGLIAHEYLHTHDFWHPGEGDNEGWAECTADGRNVSMELAESCVIDMVTDSFHACGEPFTCGDPDEVQLVSGFDTFRDRFVGTCGCASDQRHEIALQTVTQRRFVSAVNGGGSTLNAASTGRGAWETLYLIDHNRGQLQHGDIVSFRTWGADTFVSAGSTATANATADAPNDNGTLRRFRIQRLVGPGVIRNGERIALLNLARNGYLTAVGGGGGALHTNQATAIEAAHFIYHEPQRGSLVHLRASDLRVVTYDESVSPELGTDFIARELTSDGVNGTVARRRQSFWVIDQNGGQLQSGDIVSFEWAGGAGYPKFWSTCSSGLGNVRGSSNHSSNTCEQFVVERVSGTGPITHATPIRIRSRATGRFLTVTPWSRTTPSRITASQTTPTSASTFTFMLPQFDRF